MRTAALRGARLDERRLETLDAGAGTGFTTEGIVERVDADRVTMLDQSPHQLSPGRAQAGAGGRAQAARRRRGAAARDRSLRPLRLGRLDRVLARARARDRRGLPRPQAGRRGARGRARAARRPLLRALAELWMLFPTEAQYREWFERAGFEDVELSAVAPDWYRDPRSRYAVAVSGRKPAAGPSPLAPSGAVEDLRAPLGLRERLVFAGRFVLGSLAGAVFVPVGSPRRCAGAGEPRASPCPRRSPLGALWRFSRPHTVIGTTVSIVALYLIAVDTLPGTRARRRAVGPVLDAGRRPRGQRLHRRRQPARGRRHRPRQQAVPAARRGRDDPRAGAHGGGGDGRARRGARRHAGRGRDGRGARRASWSGRRTRRRRCGSSASPWLASLCISGVRSVVVNLGVYAHFSLAFGDGTVSIPPSVWALTLVVLPFSLAIAILKDVPDAEGDRRFRIMTFTVRARRAARAAGRARGARARLPRHGRPRAARDPGGPAGRARRAGTSPRSACCWSGRARADPADPAVLHALLHARVEAVLPRVRARRARLPRRLRSPSAGCGGRPAPRSGRRSPRRAPPGARSAAAAARAGASSAWKPPGGIRAGRRGDGVGEAAASGAGDSARRGGRPGGGGRRRWRGRLWRRRAPALRGVSSAAAAPAGAGAGVSSAAAGAGTGAPTTYLRRRGRSSLAAGALRQHAGRLLPRVGEAVVLVEAALVGDAEVSRPARAAGRRRSARAAGRRGSRAPRRSRRRAARTPSRRRGSRAPTPGPRSPRRGRSARPRPAARRRGRARRARSRPRSRRNRVASGARPRGSAYRGGSDIKPPPGWAGQPEGSAPG